MSIPEGTYPDEVLTGLPVFVLTEPLVLGPKYAEFEIPLRPKEGLKGSFRVQVLAPELHVVAAVWSE